VVIVVSMDLGSIPLQSVDSKLILPVQRSSAKLNAKLPSSITCKA
jgi:hypothetical protein